VKSQSLEIQKALGKTRGKKEKQARIREDNREIIMKTLSRSK